MVNDIILDSNFNISTINGKQSIANIFAKILITKIGSDMYNPGMGTDLLKSTDRTRIALEVESALRQTQNIVNSEVDRFGDVLLTNAELLNVTRQQGAMSLQIRLAFSDKTFQQLTIEV